MDLKTIQGKMSRDEYATADEFEADIRLIFQNCYEYWTQDDAVFKDCEIFETFFNKQWAQRHNKATGGPRIKPEALESWSLDGCSSSLGSSAGNGQILLMHCIV
jgi:hypothetical protein